MFRLSKWYLDAHAEDGSAFIGYAARLRWRGVAVDYGATLLALPGCGVRESSTVRRFEEPVRRPDGAVHWDSAALRVAATWHPLVPAFSRQLFGDERRSVDWECVAPAAEAHISVGGVELRGLGYVERVTMSLPPWELPVEELRWGRFAAREASVVWIDWRGPHPLRLVLRDGIEVRDVCVADGVVRASDWRLQIDAGNVRTLRDAPLLKVLSTVPGLTRLVPHRFAGTHEAKWLARAEMTSGRAIAGAVIHEVVRWRARVAD